MQLQTTFEDSLSTKNGKYDSIPVAIGLLPAASVIYTTADRTLRALEIASELVKPCGGYIEVVALQVVPQQLPLDRPHIRIDIAFKHFEEMAEQLPVNTYIHAYFCREPWAALKTILAPDAPIVIAVRKRWWPTSEEKLARKLQRAGFQVVVVKTE
jgi:hypothetical protein